MSSCMEIPSENFIEDTITECQQDRRNKHVDTANRTDDTIPLARVYDENKTDLRNIEEL